VVNALMLVGGFSGSEYLFKRVDVSSLFGETLVLWANVLLFLDC